VQYFRRVTNRMLVLPQRAQTKSIKQIKFLFRQAQNRWKFVTANVRGVANCDVILEGGVKYL